MQPDDRKLVVAVDGPAGAGKSTVARQVAKETGYIYIDSGAMYRAVTLKALRQGTDLADEEALTRLAEEAEIRIAHRDHTQVIYLDGEEVSTEIRQPQVSRQVSLVAKIPGVRLALVKLQRELAKAGGVIMDGRDIGSYVLPNADLKIFLTASRAERARRRARDLKAAGFEVRITELEKEIALRDRIDSSRSMAPLVKAPDAIYLNTSRMDFGQVVQKIREYIERQIKA